MQNLRQLLVTTTFAMLCPAMAGAESRPIENRNHVDQLRMNQIQVIGSHNSYKVAFEPELYQMMLAKVPETQTLERV